MKITRVTRGLLAALVGCAAVAVPASIGTAVASADVANTLVYKQNTDGHDCYRIPSVVKANNGETVLTAIYGRKSRAGRCSLWCGTCVRFAVWT